MNLKCAKIVIDKVKKNVRLKKDDWRGLAKNQLKKRLCFVHVQLMLKYLKMSNKVLTHCTMTILKPEKSYLKIKILILIKHLNNKQYLISIFLTKKAPSWCLPFFLITIKRSCKKQSVRYFAFCVRSGS